MKHLLRQPGIKPNAKSRDDLISLNMMGISATDADGIEVLNFLLDSIAQKASNSSSLIPPNKASTTILTGGNDDNTTSSANFWSQSFTFSQKSRLEEFRDELFTAATIKVAVTLLPMVNMQVMYTVVAFLGWNYLEALISKENGHANLNDILKCISFGFLIMSSLLTIIRLVVLAVMGISGYVKERKHCISK